MFINKHHIILFRWQDKESIYTKCVCVASQLSQQVAVMSEEGLTIKESM